ncbi:divergent PAP2 family protein [Anaerotalea alkaliphila]|uniref:Divergent PAP2 family protein n=1 Tax=Anaerotalea alkaliphila TaxID=2662126 RepID=A0A7X5KL25_9FIRM|nr:divergent PAP2 family protein [Anaerotalea alkaliphila]NDL66259.1 divergent PAP2 family protein [Anaerotalea alkaliphila]
MKEFITIIQNPVFLSAIIAWFLSQGIKVATSVFRYKRFDLERVMGSGGMPSSHTASVVASTFTAGLLEGYGSTFFGLGMVLSGIIMYDAAGVRMAAGKQARVINRIVKELGEHRFKFDENLKELLGHTYFEVVGGAVLGILIAYLHVGRH